MSFDCTVTERDFGDNRSSRSRIVCGDSPLVIRAGFEPSITALKGLCPDHLDERTILRRSDPPLLVYNENIINADMK